MVDAGYTTTDHVMEQLLDRKECKWLSATNGDNAYGSEVVHRILHAPHQQTAESQADMLLLPMDSRNFADQGTAQLFSHGILLMLFPFICFTLFITRLIGVVPLLSCSS
jgi:hypothetical protein